MHSSELPSDRHFQKLYSAFQETRRPDAFLECASFTLRTGFGLKHLMSEWSSIKQILAIPFSLSFSNFIQGFSFSKKARIPRVEKNAIPSTQDGSFQAFLDGLLEPDAQSRGLDRYPYFHAALDVEPFLSEHYPDSQNPAFVINSYLSAIFEDPWLPRHDDRSSIHSLESQALLQDISMWFIAKNGHEISHNPAFRFAVELLIQDDQDRSILAITDNLAAFLDAWTQLRKASTVYYYPGDTDLAFSLFSTWADFWHVLWECHRDALASAIRHFLESALLLPEEVDEIFSILIFVETQVTKLSYADGSKWHEFLKSLSDPVLKVLLRLHSYAEDFNGCRSVWSVDRAVEVFTYCYVHIGTKEDNNALWIKTLASICSPEANQEYCVAMYGEGEPLSERFYWFNLAITHARTLGLPELENAFLSYFLYTQSLKFRGHIAASPRIIQALVLDCLGKPGKEIITTTLALCRAMREPGEQAWKLTYGPNLDQLWMNALARFSEAPGERRIIASGLCQDPDYVRSAADRTYGELFSTRLSRDAQSVFIQTEVDGATAALTIRPEDRDYSPFILGYVGVIEMELRERLRGALKQQAVRDALSDSVNGTGSRQAGDRNATLGGILKLLIGPLGELAKQEIDRAGIATETERHVWKRLEPIVYRYRNSAAHGEKCGMKRYAEFRELLFRGDPNLFALFLGALEPRKEFVEILPPISQ